MEIKKECVKMTGKKAQVTIFIILALAIVVVLALLFLNRGNLFVVSQQQQTPVYQIQKCMSDAAKEVIGTMEAQGGSLNPAPSYLFNGSRIQYLCYTNEYYQYCVMQKPLLKQDFEKELSSHIQPVVESCLANVRDSLVKQGYTVDYKKPEVSVEIVLNKIIISSDNVSLEISKSNTEVYKSIKTEIDSKLYDLMMIASSVANQEARDGNSEIMVYMMYYPSVRLEKLKQLDDTKIYILTYKESGERFLFASRSLALPSGVLGK